MERKNNQLTFLDNVTSDLGGKRTAAFFAKCDKFIHWDQLAEQLKICTPTTHQKEEPATGQSS